MRTYLKFFRRSFPIVLAFLIIGHAQAEWALLGRTDTFRIYLDKGASQKSGSIIRTSQLIDFVTAQWVDAQTVIMSVKSLIDFDCAELKLRVLTVETYSEQMTGGRLLATDKFSNPEWESIQAGSSAEVAHKFACSENR